MPQTLDAAVPVKRWRRALVLAAVMAGVFIATLDLFALSYGLLVRLFAIGEEPPTGRWVVTSGYTLTWVVSLVLWGKLSDAFGRRRLWLAALLLFLAGSVGSLTSQELVQLTVSRITQGLGVGGILALGPALIGDLYPPSERPKWQSGLIAMYGLALIGPPLFVYLVWLALLSLRVWDVDYFFLRWSLFLNLPVVILVLLASGFGLPAARSDIRPRVDIVGAVAFAGFVVPLLVALTLADVAFPWLSVPTAALLAGAAVMLVVLVFVERRANNPMIDVRILAHRDCVAAVATLFIVGTGLTVARVNAPAFFPPVEGLTFTHNWAEIVRPAAMAPAFAVGALVAGQIMARTERHRALILVLLLIATGGAVLLSRMDGFSSAIDVIVNSSIIGLAIGGLFTVLIVVVQNAFPHRNLGEVTAGTLFIGFLGSLLGYGLLSRLSRAWFDANVGAGSAQLVSDPLIASEASLQNVDLNPQSIGGLATEILRESRLDALSGIFVVVAVLLAVGFMLILLLREAPLSKTSEDPGDEPGATAPANGSPEHPAA